MSAKIARQSADEWERQYCAEELREERKAEKAERGRVSGYAMSFIAFLEAGNVNPKVYQTVYVFLAETKNHAPEEVVTFFSEKDAGARLRGQSDIAYSSLRKRFQRGWGEIEQEQVNTGKCFAGRREKGSIRLASREADEKKSAPKYWSQIAQAVVDVERIASRLRGKREDRYRRAARQVWDALPAFTDEDVTIRLREPEVCQGKREDRLAGKQTRRLTRFVSAAEEMLAEAKKRDNAAVEVQSKELVLELGKLVAEALDVEPESALRLLADTLTEAAETPAPAKVRATSQNQNLQNSEQKRDSDSSHVDKSVHVEREGTLGYCVACGDAIHPDRLEFDTELCDLCGSPRIKPKPTAFRLIDEHEKRKKPPDEIIYAEDFTV